MSKDSRTLIWIVVAVVVIILGAIVYSQYKGTDMMSNYQKNGGENADQTSTVISSNSTSTEDLNQDMTKVDTQMSGLDSDSAAADENISNP